MGDNMSTQSKTIGSAIREERKKQRLTLNELGNRMGISGSLVGQYERGVVNPKYETIMRFAKALNITPRALLAGVWNTPFSEDLFSQGIEELFQSEDCVAVKYTFGGEMIPITAQEQLNEAFSQLNAAGKQVAVERVQELAQIPKYQRREENDVDEAPAGNDLAPDDPGEADPAEKA